MIHKATKNHHEDGTVIKGSYTYRGYTISRMYLVTDNFQATGDYNIYNKEGECCDAYPELWYSKKMVDKYIAEEQIEKDMSNTTTHKAIKNHAGNYTYRGYTIEHSHEDVTTYYGKSATWRISKDEDCFEDMSEHAKTLAQAKQTIDFWIDEIGVNN